MEETNQVAVIGAGKPPNSVLQEVLAAKDAGHSAVIVADRELSEEEKS